MREPEEGRNVGFSGQIFLLSLLRAVCDMYEDVVDWCVSEFFKYLLVCLLFLSEPHFPIHVIGDISREPLETKCISY